MLFPRGRSRGGGHACDRRSGPAAALETAGHLRGRRGHVPLPDDPDLSPGQLEGLLARSHAGEPKEFGLSVDAFEDLMNGEVPG